MLSELVLGLSAFGEGLGGRASPSQRKRNPTEKLHGRVQSGWLVVLVYRRICYATLQFQGPQSVGRLLLERVMGRQGPCLD